MNGGSNTYCEVISVITSIRIKMFPYPQTIRPIDQIQMADIVERSLVLAPLRTLHTDQAVVWPFSRHHNIV